jgi:hypothetical protein
MRNWGVVGGVCGGEGGASPPGLCCPRRLAAAAPGDPRPPGQQERGGRNAPHLQVAHVAAHRAARQLVVLGAVAGGLGCEGRGWGGGMAGEQGGWGGAECGGGRREA